MNDFRMDITGLKAVVKPHIYYKAKAKDAERTITVLSGPGCAPDDHIDRMKPYYGHGRDIVAKLADGSTERISSYDLLYVITKDGKKVKQFESEFKDVDIARAPSVDVVKSTKPRGREPWKESQA